MRLVYALSLLGLSVDFSTSNNFEQSVPSCEASVVTELSSLGILEYVLRHCAHNSATPARTLNGTRDPGGNGCLTNFVLENNLTAADSWMPRSGACRESIQTLVTSVYTKASVNFGAMGANVTALNITDTDFLVDVSSGIRVPLFDFQNSNEFSVSFPQCQADTVRNRAFETYYAHAIANAASGYTYTKTDFYDLLCEECYDLFSDVLKTSFTADPILAAACVADPHSETCKYSSSMQRAMRFFENCSGYPIEFFEPVCSDAQIASIQANVSPSPYYTFMFCALAGNDICAFIQTYFDQVTAASTKDCGGCFVDFYNNIDQTAAAKYCSTKNLLAPECAASQTEALIRFQICAGQSLHASK